MENWFRKRVQLSGNNLALVYEDRNWTFQELYEETLIWAGKLQKLSVKQQDRIAVLGGNTFTMYCTILALQQLGCEIVFLNNRLSATELSYQIQDAKIRYVLYDSAFFEKTQNIELLPTQELISFNYIGKIIAEKAKTVLEFEEETVTSIMYTSGTTGNPKGVMQTFKNHWASAIGSMLNLGLRSTDSWVLAVPLFHISGFSMMMKSLIYGVPIYLFEKFDAEKINELLISGKGGNISVVSTMLKAMLADLGDRHYHENLHCVLLGGGPIDEFTLSQCLAKNIPVIQSFGMTETASQVVALNQKDAKRKIGSSGQALFPVQIRIADEKGEKNSNDVGEIQIKAPNITKGYLNLAEKFASEWTMDGWFKTGDLGFLDEEGYLYVVSRISDLIISGGENIFPAEVENAMMGYPGLIESAVIGQPDEKWGQIPVAVIVCDDAEMFDVTKFSVYLREKIAHYKVPKKFYFLEKLPRNATGKLLRRKIVLDSDDNK